MNAESTEAFHSEFFTLYAFAWGGWGIIDSLGHCGGFLRRCASCNQISYRNTEGKFVVNCGKIRGDIRIDYLLFPISKLFFEALDFSVRQNARTLDAYIELDRKIPIHQFIKNMRDLDH